jgi:tetratricopeptide (TPR) repeat protein
VAGALVVAALGARTWVRTGDWRDELTLYTRALDVVPACARVHCSVGQQLRETGHPLDADEQIRRALEIVPTYRMALAEAGMLALDRARLQRDAPSLAQSYVWFWLAAHSPGAAPIDQGNFEQVAEVVRRTDLPPAEILRAATAIADARRGDPLYELMRKGLAPKGR